MSIGHLCDHTARVWTLAEESGAMLSRTRQYEVQEGNDGIPCTMKRKNTVLGTLPPGVAPVGDRMWYSDLGPLIKERDVIEIFEGPNAPARLEVQSVDTPRGHHIEVRGSEFRGRLPIDEEGS
jgi:hypothetical protein